MCGTKINEGVRATSAVIYESVISALILLNVANKLIKKGYSITVLTAVLDYLFMQYALGISILTLSLTHYTFVVVIMSYLEVDSQHYDFVRC